METQKKYDIFISYRREGGKNIARLLKTELGLRGYHAFLDFDELKDGRFDKRIMDAIDAAPVFMFILSEHALDRCVDENDWVRREIEYAMETERHIVPINPDKSFSDFPDYVPKNLKDGLGLHQFSQLLLDDLFNQTMDKLVSERLEPILGKRNRYKMSTTGATIHLSTDANCEVYRYGKHECNVVTGEDKIVYLKKGKHKFEFISIDNEKDKYSIVFSVEDIDMEDMLEIQLQPIIEKREIEERTRREAEERARIEERKIAEEKSRQEEERIRKEKELQAQIAQAEAAKKALEEKMRLAEEKARQAEEKANQIEKRRLAERQAREYLQKNKVEKPQELPKIETNLSVNDLCKNADNYYYGRNGVKKDYIEAFKYYQKAADKGSSHAQVRIAECYNMGRGVRLDKKEAFKWYRMAAEQGNMHAQFILGEAYETGEYGVQENREMSLKWYQRAADQGNVNAKNKVANLSSVFVDKWLKKAHDCFYGRNGVSLDYVEAAKYYQKVAELGNSHAQSNLGYCYYFGKGVKQNYSEAVRWFREAANKNDEYAQYFLGCCYYYGKGLTVDYSEAYKWYLKSGEAGFGESQYWLGICYYYGQGVMVDFKESTKWFLRSANKGHIEAQFTVGLAYEHGHGVEINISEANKWYRKAAEQGHEKAIKKINELGSINESKHRVKGYDNSKTFDVILKSAGVSKLQVVKTIKEQTGYGLKESKDIVDAAPSFIKRNVDKVIAERIKKELEDIGAIVELR